jgi:opacity protein-like surface antigen
MKKTILIIITALTGMLIPSQLFGQLKYTSTNYMVSIPFGDSKDYIENTSFRGFGFEFGQFVDDNDQLAIGLGFSWNVFNENIDEAVIERGTATITGKQFRYINALPIYVNTSYYFKDQDSKIKPYAGIGVGTMYKEQRTEIGVFAISDKKWHFAIYPHAGVLFALGNDAHINLDLKYHQAFASGNSDAVSFLSVNAGLHFIFF